MDAQTPAPSGMDGYFGTTPPAPSPLDPGWTAAPPLQQAAPMEMGTSHGVVFGAPTPAAPAAPAAAPAAPAVAPPAPAVRPDPVAPVVAAASPPPLAPAAPLVTAPPALAPAAPVVTAPVAAPAAAVVPEQATPSAAAAPVQQAVRVGAEDTSEDSAFLSNLLIHVIEEGCSDLHLTVGAHPTVRKSGGLQQLEEFPTLTPQLIQKTMYAIMSQKQREKFEEELELDFAYALPGRARFRVNVYKQRDAVGAAFRLIPYEIK